MLIVEKKEDQTSCYTYEVTLVVQVFAENLEMANERLDQNGGHVSSRKVTLLNTNVVYENDEVSTEGPSETV